MKREIHTCDNCINRGRGRKCDIMIKPFKDFSCWSDLAKQLKAEQAIFNNAVAKCESSAALSSKRRMKMLKERRALQKERE